MKRYDIKDSSQEYKIGESYIFLTYDPKDPDKIIKRAGTISQTGITSDAVPYIEVNMSGVIKKYITSILSKRVFNSYNEKMESLPDPSILGEVTIVRKQPQRSTEGGVTRVNGLPGEVTKVKNIPPSGDVTLVRRNRN